VHVAVNLYAASTVTAVAFDAAREVAGADGGRGDGQPDVVELRVRAESPSRFLPGVSLPLSSVDRTIRVRLERPR
jgi:hypothetical protein